MHPKTQSHNGYLPATESRETTQKLSFGPKQVDWHVRCEKQDSTSVAQSGALYAPQNPISQRVPPGNGIARNHPETKFWANKSGMGNFVAKTRRSFASTKWCILCTPKPDLTMGTSRGRNRAKPPRNLVLGLNK